MQLRTLALTAASLTALLAVAACSSSAGKTAASAPNAVQSSASATATDPVAAPASKAAPPADAGLPAKPDAAVTAKLVAALAAIDKDIVDGKPDKAVDNARNQCQAIYNFPKDHAKLVDLTNHRFTSPTHPNGFGPETAEKILSAVQATLCPKQ